MKLCNKIALFLMALIFLLICQLPVNGAVITFESISDGSPYNPKPTVESITGAYNDSLTSQGFVFDKDPEYALSFGAGYITESEEGPPAGPEGEGNYLLIYNYSASDDNPLVMTTGSGQLFSLTSFEAAEVFSNDPLFDADSIQVTGYKGGGTVEVATFDLDNVNDSLGGGDDFETFTLPATFTDLTYVEFLGIPPTDGSGRGFSLDNINATVVPLPGTLMLLGSGLLGLWALGRKKR